MTKKITNFNSRVSLARWQFAHLHQRQWLSVALSLVIGVSQDIGVFVLAHFLYGRVRKYKNAYPEGTIKNGYQMRGGYWYGLCRPTLREPDESHTNPGAGGSE